jgi:hypothetical protein
MQVLPPLSEALQDTECALLQTLHSVCAHEAFSELLGELEAALEEDVQSYTNSFLNR